VSHPDLLVGTETTDDAGVFRLSADVALVSTVDFFTPIVDDPGTFGAVSAANALSDVYAMGGRPITALNIACFPQRGLPMEILGEILAGGAAKAAEAGVLVIGGHTVADDEIKYGMAVTGVVHPDRVTRNAAKHDRAEASALAAAIRSMTTLNAAAAAVLADHEVHACTDVSGFSLLGHAFEMAHASGVTLAIDAAALPVLPGAREIATAGEITGGCKRNREYLADKVRLRPSIAADLVEVAFDPQTSGGLLVAVPAAIAAAVRDALLAAGVEAAAIVGEVAPFRDAAVELG
jgi:selenide, water dikinase